MDKFEGLEEFITGNVSPGEPKELTEEEFWEVVEKVLKADEDRRRKEAAFAYSVQRKELGDG